MQHRLVGARHWLRPAPVVYVSAAAWLVLVGLTVFGAGGAIRHDRLLVGGPPLWLATISFAAGWQVMVAAMMLPASLHAFARAGERRGLLTFAAGYLAVWTVFGLAVFFLDAGVHQLVNHWWWLAAHAWLIAGTALIFAGTYQLTAIKGRMLEACRMRPSAGGAGHALQCIGASGGLMLLAFALAGASLWAMAAITLVMVYEVSPYGQGTVKPLGYGLIGVGVLVLYGPIPL